MQLRSANGADVQVAGSKTRPHNMSRISPKPPMLAMSSHVVFLVILVQSPASSSFSPSGPACRNVSRVSKECTCCRAGYLSTVPTLG